MPRCVRDLPLRNCVRAANPCVCLGAPYRNPRVQCAPRTETATEGSCACAAGGDGSSLNCCDSEVGISEDLRSA